jgi:hypothetical protein
MVRRQRPLRDACRDYTQRNPAAQRQNSRRYKPAAQQQRQTQSGRHTENRWYQK